MNSSNRGIFGLLAIIIVGLIVWAVLTMPDQRTTGQKIGDAVDTLPKGVDKAARELEDRTPGEKLGDAVIDTGEEIKESTDR